MNSKIKIQVTEIFAKKIKKFSKKHPSLKEDLKNLIEELEKNPNLGTDLGNGFRKIRFAVKSKNKGKRGGYRIITYRDLIFKVSEDKLYLVFIYDKSQTSNITKNKLLKIIKEELD